MASSDSKQTLFYASQSIVSLPISDRAFRFLLQAIITSPPEKDTGVRKYYMANAKAAALCMRSITSRDGRKTASKRAISELVECGYFVLSRERSHGCGTHEYIIDIEKVMRDGEQAIDELLQEGLLNSKENSSHKNKRVQSEPRGVQSEPGSGFNLNQGWVQSEPQAEERAEKLTEERAESSLALSEKSSLAASEPAPSPHGPTSSGSEHLAAARRGDVACERIEACDRTDTNDAQNQSIHKMLHTQTYPTTPSQRPVQPSARPATGDRSPATTKCGIKIAMSRTQFAAEAESAVGLCHAHDIPDVLAELYYEYINTSRHNGTGTREIEKAIAGGLSVQSVIKRLAQIPHDKVCVRDGMSPGSITWGNVGKFLETNYERECALTDAAQVESARKEARLILDVLIKHRNFVVHQTPLLSEIESDLEKWKSIASKAEREALNDREIKREEFAEMAREMLKNVTASMSM